MASTAECDHHSVDKHVGALIRSQRKAKGISQSELADALRITYQQVQKYETGANRISSSKLYEVAQKLDLPFGAFFEGLEYSGPPGATNGNLLECLSVFGARDLLTAFRSMTPALRTRLIALAVAITDVKDETSLASQEH